MAVLPGLRYPKKMVKINLGRGVLGRGYLIIAESVQNLEN